MPKTKVGKTLDGGEQKIVGTSFHQQELHKLAENLNSKFYAFLVPDPENQYDANAIRVDVVRESDKERWPIGHIPKGLTAFYHEQAAGQILVFRAYLRETPGGDIWVRVDEVP